MNFIEYLQIRHTIEGGREIKEKSAHQYNNRLKNLKKNKIYNGENYIDNQILRKIKGHYKDTTNHYSRTIKYYNEFINYLNKTQQKA
ncbi:hypothetical protein [Peribacillus simplex]|uniref:hypothetical protein n=1 Tax=Peribacillus simplex TaxID=1478 RepID=UPI003D28EFCF